MQQRILNLIENPTEEDEIDLAFASISKCMKRSLNEEQQENLMDEINILVSKHIKMAKSGQIGVFSGHHLVQLLHLLLQQQFLLQPKLKLILQAGLLLLHIPHLPPPLQPIAQMHVDPYGNNNTNNGYFE